MKAISIVLLFSAPMACILIMGCVAGAPDSNGILAGNVTVGPLAPVERIDVTPTAPPPEVFTGRHLTLYEADGVTKVMDVPIVAAGLHGAYSVYLRPGTYVLDYEHTGVGHASPLPAKVLVEAGKVTTVDVDIDTGIR